MTYDFRASERIPSFSMVTFKWKGKTIEGRLMTYDKDGKHANVFVKSKNEHLRLPVSDLTLKE